MEIATVFGNAINAVIVGIDPTRADVALQLTGGQ